MKLLKSSINKIFWLCVVFFLCVISGIVTIVTPQFIVAYAATYDNSIVYVSLTYEAGGTDFSGSGYMSLPDSSYWKTVLSGVSDNGYTGFRFQFIKTKDKDGNEVARTYSNSDNVAITTGSHNNWVVTIDLNGNIIQNAQPIEHGGRTLIIDSSDGGEGSFLATGNTVMEYRGSRNTQCEFYISADSQYIRKNMTTVPLKIYGGIVTKIVNQGNSSREIKLAEYLPEGYAYVSDSGRMIPYETANSLNGFTPGVFTSMTVNTLTTVECLHDKIENGKCTYCNTSIDGSEALETAKKEIDASMEKARNDLEAAKTDLVSKINTKVDQTSYEEAIKNLNDQIEAVNNTIADNKTAADNADASLKEELTDYVNIKAADLINAISAAKEEAVNTANANLNTAKEELTASIATNTESITEINGKIDNVNSAIDKINAVSGLLDSNSTTDNELANAIKTAISAAKEEAINTANDNLNTAKEELTASIATNTESITEINGKIEALNAAIEVLQTTTEALGVKDTELENAISAAKADVLATVNTNLETLKAELNAKIASKADAATLNAKIAELTNAVENAQAISDASTDEKDQAVKAELMQAINNAKDVLQTAINALSVRLDDAETKIDKNAEDIKVLKSITYLSLGIMFVVGIIAIVTGVAVKNSVKIRSDKKDKDER